MAKKKSKSRNTPTVKTRPSLTTEAALLEDLRQLIADARRQTAQAVNTALTLTYWEIGQRIHLEILQQQRAEYGKQIVSTLSAQLVPEFGNGFREKSLRRMIQFAEIYPDQPIVVTLSRQLSWSHFVELIPLKDDLQRDFYAEMCRVERWSVRTLRDKINGMLFERTALSKKPVELAQQELATLREEDRLTPEMVFRDPYFLDFLGLKDTYSERDLEGAIAGRGVNRADPHLRVQINSCRRVFMVASCRCSTNFRALAALAFACSGFWAISNTVGTIRL